MLRTVLLSVSLLVLMLLAFAAWQPARFVNAADTTSETAVAGAIKAATAANQGQCSVATLKGRYLFAHSGTFLPPAFGVTGPTPGADAGFHLFNGDGTGTDIVTLRVGNDIVVDNGAFPFTYTVNADCTGHVVVGDGPSFNIFVSPKGDEVGYISTAPPGNSVSDIDHRVSQK